MSKLNMKTKSDYELSQLIQAKGPGWIKASVELANRVGDRGEDPGILKERALQPMTAAERWMAASLLVSSTRLTAPLDLSTRNFDVSVFGIMPQGAYTLMTQFFAVNDSPPGTCANDIADHGNYGTHINAGCLATLLAAKLTKEATGK